MPETKIVRTTSASGQNVYCLVKRQSDGYLLNDADGAFASAPADPYLALTEDATIKGLYSVSESRTVWTNGYYDVIFYARVGSTPSLTADEPPLVGATLDLYGDKFITFYELVSSTDWGLAGIRTTLDQIYGVVSTTNLGRVIQKLLGIEDLINKVFAQVGEIQRIIRRVK